jgi:hypothetical protein
MLTRTANPATRASANRGLVTRPLANVLLAMGAISLAAAPGSALASSSTGSAVEASSSSIPATTAAGHTVMGDGTLAPDDRRARLSE